jgi:hypothetical protein
MTIEGLDKARTLLEGAVLGPAEIERVLGFDPLTVLDDRERADVGRLPFTDDELKAAQGTGSLLVLRVARDPSGPITMLGLAARLANALDPKVHKGVGYQLRDEWVIDGQPFAEQETPETGWRLVARVPDTRTLGKTYRLQDAAMAPVAAATTRCPVRRSAVEIAWDTLLWREVSGHHLLSAHWDWSRTETDDNAFVAVGGFGPDGLGVIGYSGAVRFGTLGICPQR